MGEEVGDALGTWIRTVVKPPKFPGARVEVKGAVMGREPVYAWVKVVTPGVGASDAGVWIKIVVISSLFVGRIVLVSGAVSDSVPVYGT